MAAAGVESCTSGLTFPVEGQKSHFSLKKGQIVRESIQ
jgi:hypothetical protein